MRNKNKIEWSPEMAYAVGLIATDGCLSSDGRHVDLTSKDIEQLDNFNRCLKSKHKVAWKVGGSGRKYPHLQFSDVTLYRWLTEIGLTPNKTQTISSLRVPLKYFPHFLRGHFDGDGSIHAFWDKRWRSSYLVYTSFISASRKHLEWLNTMIEQSLGVEGRISLGKRVFRLRFAKKSSVVILSGMYKGQPICLSRKKKKVFEILKQAAVLESVYRHA